MISSFCKKIKLLGHFSGVFVKSLNLPGKKIVAYGQNFIVLQMTKYRTNNLAIWSHCIWSHCIWSHCIWSHCIWPSAVGKYPVDCIKTCLSNYRPFLAAASFLFKQEKKQWTGNLNKRHRDLNSQPLDSGPPYIITRLGIAPSDIETSF